MELPLSQGLAQSPVDVDVIADFIAGVQKPNGEIPWSIGGKTDPWDHVESAMGLSIAGRLREAEMAYRWMVTTSRCLSFYRVPWRHPTPYSDQHPTRPKG